jgi:hypothetical protein
MTLTGPDVLTNPPWARLAKKRASELVLAASHLAAAPHEEPA